MAAWLPALVNADETSPLATRFGFIDGKVSADNNVLQVTNMFPLYDDVFLTSVAPPLAERGDCLCAKTHDG